MSRLLVTLVLALTAATATAAPQFARPPQPGTEASIDQADVAIDRAALRGKLAEQRAANLARFRAYARRGVFPSNTYSDGLLNVWRDAAGHYCAAATIIDASGKTALVAEVARTNNFIRLADVKDGALLDWILTSGLTQAEIVAIQKPFSGVGRKLPRPDQDLVDPDKRVTETARLAKLYAQVDAGIVKNERASLDAAVERLLQHPQLATQLLAQR